MSKARLIITALLVEGQSPAEVARRYRVHRAWVYELKARHRVEGDGALQPRSRRPKTSPTATSDATAELVLDLRNGWSGSEARPGSRRSSTRPHRRCTQPSSQDE